MKLLKSIYLDDYGNEWILQCHEIPKQDQQKDGVYVYWTGECPTLNLSFKEKLKRKLIFEIETHMRKKQGSDLLIKIINTN